VPVTVAHHASVGPVTAHREAVLLVVHLVSVLVYEAAAQMQRVLGVLMQRFVWSEVQAMMLVAPLPGSVYLWPIQVALVKLNSSSGGSVGPTTAVSGPSTFVSVKLDLTVRRVCRDFPANAGRGTPDKRRLLQ